MKDIIPHSGYPCSVREESPIDSLLRKYEEAAIASKFYQRNYSVSNFFKQLRENQPHKPKD